MVNATHIKSFVLRLSRISEAQKEALQELWPRYGLDIAEYPYDYAELFQRPAPLVVEIGFGMGHALVNMAQQIPDHNFIGIEVHKPGIAAVLIELNKADISNVRLFQTDAVEVLQRAISDNSIQQFNIYFPDPWPKRRHYKRRLIQPTFIELLYKKLAPGGKVHLATDWQDYAQHMLAVFSAASGFDNVAGKDQFIPRPEIRPLTKFEQRGHRLGHGVWDLLFVKKI